MFCQFFCPFPTPNFAEFHFPRFCPFFFLFPFFFSLHVFFFFFSFFSFCSFCPTSPFHTTSIFSPPPPPISLLHTLLLLALATTASCRHPCHHQPTNLQALPSLAITILFSLFFGVQVSLKCKSLCFGLWVCFHLVFL